MRFCVFQHGEAHRLGGTLDEAGRKLVDLSEHWPADTGPAPADVAALARLGDRGLDIAADLLRRAPSPLDAASLTLLAPMPRLGRNVFCVGRNYREHIIEGNIAQGRDPHLFPEHIEFFTKATNTVNRPGGTIPLHAGLTRILDYEAELGIVIGASGVDIPVDQAERHVFGYTIVNDVTGRDLQRAHGQWFKGKSLDGCCPFGPWVVHRSAVPDPHALGIRLWVDDELRQNGNTSSMLFRVEDIVSKLSAGLTLEAGDLIATGTPSGVGYAMKPPRPLAAGNRVFIEIDGLGRLENVVGPA
jgi:2-keto-4-pentenoate hydratase/2-oxohepta-3-ene-1,7-dioic acid hydratase in catechol pathway